MVLMHHHGNVGIGFSGSQDQVAQKDLTCVAACATGSLQDDRTIGLVGRFHDCLHLFKVVDVECRNAVAVFGSVVEQKPKRNERHRESPKKSPIGLKGP
ncbi:MAG: Uncharacterised protein [Synechococcus sp. MIT S9220]|nr:MAG: Uncharacterised protein [Synechococcus sp. MIT S9220]